MKLLLQALQHEDPASIFVCRKINTFGFKSPDRLRQYFSKYGQVKGVYVSHSHVKSMRMVPGKRESEIHSRLRAASLGFVVMSTAEAVKNILKDGPEHQVRGSTIRVSVFYRRCLETSQDDDEPEDQEDDGSPAQASSRGNGYGPLGSDGTQEEPGASANDPFVEFVGFQANFRTDEQKQFERGVASRNRWADHDPSLDVSFQESLGL